MPSAGDDTDFTPIFASMPESAKLGKSFAATTYWARLLCYHIASLPRPSHAMPIFDDYHTIFVE